MIQRKQHRREAGMSLVELMVGMLIGLIGIVIITHLYVTNDQYKRSTTGAGTAHINGVVALYSLEREIRMSGYGINHPLALNCKCVPVTPNCSPLQYYYGGNASYPPAPAAGGALPARIPVPVLISDNPGPGPDTITILYGGSNERVLPAAITEDALAATNHDYRIDYVQGFDKNNLILVAAENGTCLLKQVSKVQGGLLEHTSGNYNPPGSFGPDVKSKSAVFNLGTLTKTGGPVWRSFFVANNQLQAEDLLRSLEAGAPHTRQLVDDIVDLQAQYGKDKVGADGIVDTWDNLPPGEGEWPFVLAVRVGVLARSQNYEKPANAGDPCTATEAAPGWSGGAFTVPDGLPSCYKYRAFETVIPLRNVIWKQE